MKQDQSKLQEVISAVKEQLLEAGYATVLEVPSYQTTNCDLIAYASAPNGAAIGTAVEVLVGDELNMVLAAAKLDLARVQVGVEGGLLITGSKIFNLSSDGATFVQVDEIPPVSADQSPIASQKVITNIMWPIAQEFRGRIQPGEMSDKILDLVSAEDGVVSLPNSGLRLDGQAFRQFLTRKASLGKTHFVEGQASADVQELFATLAKLFPSTKSIFDPFFGAGLATYAAVDALRSFSGVSKVSGFEINPAVKEKADKLRKTVQGLIQCEIQLGTAITQDWDEADLLITEPPLGLRLNQPISIESVLVRDVETFTILKSAMAVHSGLVGGAAIILTSRGWLSRERDQPLRDKLLELGLVRAIIGLPNLKSNTSMSLAAIVLAKGDSQVVFGELFEDWREQLNGDAGGLYELLKF